MILSVTVVADNKGILRVHPVGAIDSETYELLERKLVPVLAAKPKIVIFDMKDVDYVSSMGINVVFNVRKTLEEHGGTLIMTGLQPQVQKVFDIVKMLQGMKVFSSVAEMDEYLKWMQKKSLN